MDMMDERNDDEFDVEEGTAERAKQWLQENLRIIVSVFIVAAIALGIYSYSDRGTPASDNVAMEELSSSESTERIEEEGDTENVEKETLIEEDTQINSEEVTPVETSRETEGSFVETASAGNGLTHLARAATRHYLEKNPDSMLTAEHKIYIEDYLRKTVGHTGGIHTGTSVEFSKDLVREAIEKSKMLNERQLENLKQYSARVAEFRK